MRIRNLAWKTVWVISVLVFMWQVPTSAQQTERDTRVDRLSSSDPSVRGAVKAELLAHPDPALLPALLKALPSSKGTICEDLLEVLGKYDDPRKIPVLLALRKSAPGFGTGTGGIEDQLSRLGAPAADALLANCTDENYADWAAGVLSWMHATGARFLIEAVLSDDSCKHEAGLQGLFYMFGEADRESNEATRAEIEFAVGAAFDSDDRIRAAARNWFASLKGKEENADFSGMIEALIAAYQANAPPDTMVGIAEMLSERPRPRVTRFMRAAVHAPNPEIQRIAREYLSKYPPREEPPAGRVITNPRTSEQKIAFLNQLSDSLDEDVNLKIVPFLRDKDADVRAQAAERLGDLNAPSSDPRAEGFANPATALPGLREAVKDPSAKVRAAAIKALGQTYSAEDAELLVAGLKDTDGSVAASAMEALQNVPSDSAVPVLTEIYRDEKTSLELRKNAVFTLESICNPDSIPIFLEELQSDAKMPSFGAATALECALRKRPDASAYAPILKAIHSPALQDPWRLPDHKSLVHALGETKNPEAFGALTQLLDSPTRGVRCAAADALGLLGDARATPFLTPLLKNLDYDLRLCAASALSRFSNFSAPPELIAALADGDAVQMAAATALVRSNDPKAIEALITGMAAHPVAIRMLGESHDPRVVPALVAFLQDATNDSWKRANAATSLGTLGDTRAVEPLIATLTEDSSAIVMNVASALGQLKDKRAVEPLKQAYARWGTGQRQNAITVQGFIVDALRELGVADVIKSTTGMPPH